MGVEGAGTDRGRDASLAGGGAEAARGAERQLLPRAERQAAILRGAAVAFAHSGYAATSMEEIAAASGITKLIVYRHFPSKEELYRAVLQRVADRLAEEFVAGLASGVRPGIGTRAFLSVARENPDAFQLLWRHAAREPEFASYAHELRERAVWAAKALLADRLEDPSLHEWAAETVVGFLVEAVLNWIDYGDDDRDDDFVELTANSLQALVGAWSGPSRGGGRGGQRGPSGPRSPRRVRRG